MIFVWVNKDTILDGDEMDLKALFTIVDRILQELLFILLYICCLHCCFVLLRNCNILLCFISIMVHSSF